MKKTLLTLVLGTTLSLSSAFADNELEIVPFEGPKVSTRALVKYEPSKEELSKALVLVEENKPENKLLLVPYDAEFAKKQSGATQEEVESWGSWAMNKAVGAAKYVGGKLVDSGAETAKYLLAWNLNYYGVNAVEELTAYGIYAGATLVGGPVAGETAYYVTKAGIKVARWVLPGFDGFIAGTYAPLTKTFVVDPLVDNAPAIAKAAVSTASTCAGYVKSAYNYFWGS